MLRQQEFYSATQNFHFQISNFNRLVTEKSYNLEQNLKIYKNAFRHKYLEKTPVGTKKTPFGTNNFFHRTSCSVCTSFLLCSDIIQIFLGVPALGNLMGHPSRPSVTPVVFLHCSEEACRKVNHRWHGQLLPRLFEAGTVHCEISRLRAERLGVPLRCLLTRDFSQEVVVHYQWALSH